MNGKKAKMLRRVAEDLTQGRPNVIYDNGSPPFFMTNYDSWGMAIGYTKIAKGVPTRMAQDCTRALYKQLKARLC